MVIGEILVGIFSVTLDLITSRGVKLAKPEMRLKFGCGQGVEVNNRNVLCHRTWVWRGCA